MATPEGTIVVPIKRLQLAALNERLRKDPDMVLGPHHVVVSIAGPQTSRTVTGNNPSSLLRRSNSPKGETSQRGNPQAKRIHVAIRKRPLNLGEEQLDPRDCVEVDSSTSLCVYEHCRKVDLTPFTETHSYVMDAAYDHRATNVDVYRHSVSDVVRRVVDEGGRGTVFVFGPSGTGKTHTMFGSDYEPGLYRMAAGDVFRTMRAGTKVSVIMYELCGTVISDLLNDGALVQVREDGRHDVVVVGAVDQRVDTPKALAALVSKGLAMRHSRATTANETSSRSHAVLVMTLRGGTEDKLTFVDLAGAERAGEAIANDRQAKAEAKEINRSLLALKECIRAVDMGLSHVPYRGDKLTELLKDCFTGRCHAVMIASVSPAACDVEATLNTVRYAYRVRQLQKPGKEKDNTVSHGKSGAKIVSAYGAVKVPPRPTTPTDHVVHAVPQQVIYAVQEVAILRAEIQKKDVAHHVEIKLMQDRIRLLMRENERLRRRY